MAARTILDSGQYNQSTGLVFESVSQETACVPTPSTKGLSGIGSDNTSSRFETGAFRERSLMSFVIAIARRVTASISAGVTPRWIGSGVANMDRGGGPRQAIQVMYPHTKPAPTQRAAAPKRRSDIGFRPS